MSGVRERKRNVDLGSFCQYLDKSHVLVLNGIEALGLHPYHTQKKKFFIFGKPFCQRPIQISCGPEHKFPLLIEEDLYITYFSIEKKSIVIKLISHDFFLLIYSFL